LIVREKPPEIWEKLLEWHAESTKVPELMELHRVEKPHSKITFYPNCYTIEENDAVTITYFSELRGIPANMKHREEIWEKLQLWLTEERI